MYRIISCGKRRPRHPLGGRTGEMNKRILVGAAAAMLVAGIARAEVLEITGEFAAPNREASLLRSISVDRIEGQDGQALARAIEQGLAGTHFALMGGHAGRGNADRKSTRLNSSHVRISY